MNCLAQRKKFKGKHPAWNDPSDVSHENVGQESGDQKDGDDASDSEISDDDRELYVGDVRSKKTSLESKELRFKHLLNINNERSYNGPVNRVQFHPKAKVALVTLNRGQADLFEVDGEKNRYIQNLKLPRAIAPYCLFKPDGNSIVITSKSYKGIFYTYDMTSASTKKYSLKVGIEPRDMDEFKMHDNLMACKMEGSQEVIVLSSKTYENTFSVKINEPVKSIEFSNSNEIFIAGQNAQVYIWDIRKTSICKHKFQDEGSVHITSLALSETSKQLSVGSDTGFVNSYEIEQCRTERFPSPIKSFTNLKSSIEILEYNNTGELLLMASRADAGAFRMIHSHSGIVYKNFPAAAKKYGNLFSADFSPLSGYLALGCSSGRAHLCRIPYYKSY